MLSPQRLEAEVGDDVEEHEDDCKECDDGAGDADRNARYSSNVEFLDEGEREASDEDTNDRQSIREDLGASRVVWAEDKHRNEEGDFGSIMSMMTCA